MYGFSISVLYRKVKSIPLQSELLFKIKTRQIDLIAEVFEKYELCFLNSKRYPLLRFAKMTATAFANSNLDAIKGFKYLRCFHIFQL